MKNKKMARNGPQNGRWKGGVSKTYYRKEMGCKPNDRKIVHHTKQRKKGTKKIPHTNWFAQVLDNRGISARAKHNKAHPEKGGYHVSKKRKR